MSDRLRAQLPRVAGVLLVAAWVVFSWPELRAHTFERFTAWALLAGVLAAAVGRYAPRVGSLAHAALTRPPERWFVAGVALVGAAITAWVHHVPMHDQVVSGDACMYVAQSRPLAHLQLGFPVSAPRLAYAAKFLMEGADGRLHGIFVPGYPLFLALFTAWDGYLAAALVTSVLLTVAHALVARAVLRDVFTARLAVLLLLPSFARAIETADLISHAFTGSLTALCLAAALALRERPSLRLAAAIGLCAGWVFGSRMLDGFVLAAVLAAALLGPVVRRKVGARHVAVALACALPFVALVAAQQHAATGSWRRPVTIEYADRSDWPPRCLHLGFGWEVGCRIEHASERASFGRDGYTPDDGLRLIRERTGRHGAEVFGVALVGVLGFVAVAVLPSFELLVAALFAVLLTAAYGLYYYGNAIVHGARHVFPAAPLTTALVAFAVAALAQRLGRGDDASVARARGAALLGALAFVAVALFPAWRRGVYDCDRTQNIRGLRIDIRKLLHDNRIDRGIVIFPDVHSYLAAVDPWRDGDRIALVHDDLSGEQDLRRFRPDLPVYLVLRDGRILPVRSAAPAPGLQLEFERAWPSFQRPEGLAAMILHTDECCRIATSGNRALALFDVHPQATLDIPFDVATTGVYNLRLDGLVGPEEGRYEVLIDGAPLLTWDGYAPVRRFARGEPSAPRALSRGPHTFTARCLGRAPESTGYEAVFDALVATPAP